MSISAGLFAGVAAVSAGSSAFGVISDNIANANTIGYKESEARFSTLVTRTTTLSAFSPGGVVARPISNAQQQGLLQASSSGTDLAIDGNGFFVVNAAAVPGDNDQYSLTRAGSFNPDENGRLVNTAGYFLQGYITNADGTLVNSTTSDLLTSLETVDLSQFGSAANATATVNLAANLPAGGATSATETTNITIFDSEGFDHLVTFNWTKSAAANTWTYSIDLTRDPGTSSAFTTNVGGPFTMGFNGNGTLNSVAGTVGASNTTATQSITITSAQFGRSVFPSTISIDFGIYDQSTGLSQFDSPYAASLLNQDGSGPSALTGVDINDDGLVSAQFANGQSRAIYQIPIATVPAPTELDPLSGNAYMVTGTSGDIVLNTPNSGGSGRIQSGSLEGSTTDIAEEFTDLIITQRSFSAATRVITTGDELLNEIINVRR